jgi:hypothetical protein
LLTISPITLTFHQRLAYIIGWAEDWSRIFVYEFDPSQPSPLSSAKDMIANGTSCAMSSLENLLDTRFKGVKARVFLYAPSPENTRGAVAAFEKALNQRKDRITFEHWFTFRLYMDEDGSELTLGVGADAPLKIGKHKINPVSVRELLSSKDKSEFVVS